MKKTYSVISLLLVLCMVLSLAACGGSIGGGTQDNVPSSNQPGGEVNNTTNNSTNNSVNNAANSTANNAADNTSNNTMNQENTSNIPEIIELANGITQTTVPWYRGPMNVYTSPNTGFTKKTPPGTIIMGSSSNVNIVWPMRTNAELSWVLNVYDPLISKNFVTGEFEPCLATAWEFDSDGALQLTLREGVKFHDGSDFDAKDVFYTIQQNIDNVESMVRDECINIDMEKSYSNNPYHVALIMKEPSSSLITTLATGFMGIISKTFNEAVGPDFSYLETDCGTGPYTVVETITGNSQTFKRFDGYWGTVPEIETVIYRIYKDYTPMFIDFLNGDIDICFNNNFDSVTRFFNGEATDTIFQLVPVNRATTLYLLSKEGEPFADVRVRQALAHCINYDEVGIGVFGGDLMYTKPTSILLAGMAHAIDLGPLEYDPQKAASLMAEAGYNTTDKRLSVKLIVSESANNNAAAEIVQYSAAKIGIDIEVESVTNAAVFRRTEQKECDMVCALLEFTSGHPSVTLARTLMTQREGALQYNVDAVYNERYIELFTEANHTTDFERADYLYSEIQKMFREECWAIPLCVNTSAIFSHSYLQNTTLASGYHCIWKDWVLVQ